MNYFLVGVPPSQKAKLEQSGIPCYDFAIGAQDGLMIEEGYLQPAVEILDATIKSEAPSEYEGVQRVELAYVIKGTGPAQRALVAGTWSSSSNPYALLDVVWAALSQYLKRDMVVSHHSKPVSPVDDGRFHIHLFSSPPRSDRKTSPSVQVPRTIWGVSLPSHKAFSATGKGRLFSDGNFAVAELVDTNNLYVLVDIGASSTNEELELLKLLLRSVLPFISEDAKLQQTRNLFVDECSKSALRALPRANEDDDAGQKMRQLQTELGKLVRGAHAAEMKVLRNDAVNTNAFGDEYRALMRVKQVKDVRVEEGVIIVDTDILKARDDRSGVYHEIGAFRIQLDPAQTSPRWFNKTRRVDALNPKQQAPHVWQDGRACLGNTADLFPQLFAQRQWSIAAQLAIEFVQNVNTNDNAGVYVTRWPVTTPPAIQPNGRQSDITLDAAHQAHLNAYIAACAARVDELLKNSREEVVSLRKQIESLQMQLVIEIRSRLMRDRRKSRQKLFDRAEIAQQFDELRQLPKVKHVEVERGLIRVTTHSLAMTDTSTGKVHELGEVNIWITTDGQTDMIRCGLKDGKQQDARFKQQQTPLVFNSGRACFVDIREAYPDLIANFQFASATQLTIDFLEQCDVEHPAGKFICRWPLAGTSQNASQGA